MKEPASPSHWTGQLPRRILGATSLLEKDMRLPHISAVVLLGMLAGCSEHAGSPLSPTPEKRLQGTYTLTAATSPSCEFQGSWTFRADITQSGRDLDVKLWKPDGGAFCPAGGIAFCARSFHGQDDADGVRFFPEVMDCLFMSVDPHMWFCLSPIEKRGTGHALGQYVDGRIEALYDGQVSTFKSGYSDGRDCYASNHPLTFVRR